MCGPPTPPPGGRPIDLAGEWNGAAGSPYDGRSLGDTRARTRTGASIVAVVRHGQVVASPRPDFVFHPDDIVVVVGTADGTAAVARLLVEG